MILALLQGESPMLTLQGVSVALGGGVLWGVTRLSFRVGRLFEQFEDLRKEVSHVKEELKRPELHCLYAPRPGTSCEEKGGD